MAMLSKGASAISKSEYELTLSVIESARIRKKTKLREDTGLTYDEADRATWMLLRDYNIIRLMWITGMRRAELSSLLREDINQEADGAVSIRYIRKRGQETYAVLPSVEYEKLSRLIKFTPNRSKYIFPNGRGGQISNTGMCRIVGGWLHRSLGSSGRQLSCHSIRKGAAITLLDMGLSLVEIRDFLNHESIKTTEVYVGYKQSRKDRATSALISGSLDNEIKPKRKPTQHLRTRLTLVGKA